MKKLVLSALVVTSVLVLPGCWGAKEEKSVETPVSQEVQPSSDKPVIPAGEQVAPVEEVKPEAVPADLPKSAEDQPAAQAEVPAKM